jgi:hypothetical protein
LERNAQCLETWASSAGTCAEVADLRQNQYPALGL